MAEPNRPAITPAQLLAALVAGVPVVANLLRSFGVYDLSKEGQDALTSTMQWALGVGGVLAAADAVLRAARNHAHAKVVAAVQAGPSPVRITYGSASRSEPAAPYGNVAVTSRGEADEGEPPPLGDDELDDDPEMGDPLDAGPDSYKADPDDTRGADDHPKKGRKA